MQLVDALAGDLKSQQLSRYSKKQVVGAQGVAARMIETAKQLAAAAGVEQLYVHVRTRNAAALALYHRRSGFAIERRETETEGHKLGRPPRVLLRGAV